MTKRGQKEAVFFFNLIVAHIGYGVLRATELQETFTTNADALDTLKVSMHVNHSSKHG